MKVLLRQAVENLGMLGDVVNVKAGYARNYLLPQGIAIKVSEANMQLIDQERERAKTQELARVGNLKLLADTLAETSVTIEGRANEEGHLFGSVNAAQIAAALKERGLPLEERQIRLEHPLKEIGVFDVPVHLHADVEAVTKVWVVQAKPE
ncbi:MAG: 50S ribosomal protein L9 [Planctomycetota bacterium]|jgi:large subunit ribosomal protein L9